MKAKIIERVEKLLRLASPTSGSTEHERSAAALEAAKLIAEHDLTVKERELPPPKPPRRERPATKPFHGVIIHGEGKGKPFPPRPTGPGGGWMRSTATRDSVCADPSCGEEIARGDPVWLRHQAGTFNVEYLHIDGPCGW